MEKVLNNMFLGERKQGNWFQFHLPTVKSVKALLCMYDFAFQNSNPVTVTQKKSFSETVNCQTVKLGIVIGFALMMSEMYDFYPYTMLGK